MGSIKSISILLGVLFIIQGCASSGLALSEPHLYNNSYIESVKAVDQALRENNLAVLESDEQPKSYYIKVYSVRTADADVLASDPAFRNDMLHTADIWIKEVAGFTTEIKVVEEDQSGLTSASERQNLARDFYRKLNRILTLKEEASTEG